MISVLRFISPLIQLDPVAEIVFEEGELRGELRVFSLVAVELAVERAGSRQPGGELAGQFGEWLGRQLERGGMGRLLPRQFLFQPLLAQADALDGIFEPLAKRGGLGAQLRGAHIEPRLQTHQPGGHGVVAFEKRVHEAVGEFRPHFVSERGETGVGARGLRYRALSRGGGGIIDRVAGKVVAACGSAAEPKGEGDSLPGTGPCVLLVGQTLGQATAGLSRSGWIVTSELGVDGAHEGPGVDGWGLAERVGEAGFGLGPVAGGEGDKARGVRDAGLGWSEGAGRGDGGLGAGHGGWGGLPVGGEGSQQRGPHLGEQFLPLGSGEFLEAADAGGEEQVFVPAGKRGELRQQGFERVGFAGCERGRFGGPCGRTGAKHSFSREGEAEEEGQSTQGEGVERRNKPMGRQPDHGIELRKKQEKRRLLVPAANQRGSPGDRFSTRGELDWGFGPAVGPVRLCPFRFGRRGTRTGANMFSKRKPPDDGSQRIGLV